MEIDSRSKSLAEMEDYFKRDVDLVRHRAIAVKEEPKFECTLDDEMLPPPYRFSHSVTYVCLDKKRSIQKP